MEKTGDKLTQARKPTDVGGKLPSTKVGSMGN
jgi:hypothetical protein